MSSGSRFVSAVSQALDASEAVAEVLALLARDAGAVRPEALFVFISPHHRDDYALILERLSESLEPGSLVGCSGGGVIGGGQELEDSPALSVTAAFMPGARLRVKHIEDADLPDADAAPRAWEERVGVAAIDRPDFVLLVTPFMSRAEDLLLGLDYAFPHSAKAGGLASGMRSWGERSLFWGRQTLESGALVMSIMGGPKLRTLVAQGCRGVGPTYTVSSVERNLLLELDGQNALQVLNKVHEAADGRDQNLMRRALFVGLQLPDGRGEEALIRNVVGIDADRKAIALGAVPRVGQRLRFYLRDAEAAAGDLRRHLLDFRAQHPKEHPVGGLLFSCMGRGERMYGIPSHDTQLFNELLGPAALGGFFCNGEIGQVGAGTYIHGFTSSFALFVDEG